MTQQPSGWYDDPDDETQLRYFDGILWTDRIMPKLRPGLEHVGEARPRSELPTHTEPARRDGEPRTYPAHWGPEGTQPTPHGPSGVPQPPLATPGQGAGQPAGLGARFLANIIDRIVISLLLGVGFVIFGGDSLDLMQQWMRDVMSAVQDGATQTPDMPGPLQTAMVVLTVATAVLGTLYDAIMTSFCHGRTVGRMALGVAVVPAATAPDTTALGAARVPLGRALVRSIIKWGPEAIGGVGEFIQIGVFLSALSNARRAGLHDRLAGTEVRRTR